MKIKKYFLNIFFIFILIFFATRLYSDLVTQPHEYKNVLIFLITSISALLIFYYLKLKKKYKKTVAGSISFVPFLIINIIFINDLYIRIGLGIGFVIFIIFTISFIYLEKIKPKD